MSGLAVDQPAPSPAPEEGTQGGVINSVAYQDGKRVAVVSIPDLGQVHRTRDWLLWVGLYEPDAALLAEVQEAFDLHELAIEDAREAHQRPKLEIYGDGLFVVLRTVRLADDPGAETHHLEFGETHVFLGDRYVVTVRHGSLKSHVGLRARCEAMPESLAKGPGFILHALMDFVVDQYFPVIESLEVELRALERQIFGENPHQNLTGRLYRLQRDLLALRRAVAPLIDLSSHLMRYETHLIRPETRPYFQNVNDHVLRISEAIDHQLELARTALEANLALNAQALNDDTKRLAAWAAIIAVPTLIAGIYGMNFTGMPELHWRFGYPIAMSCMGLVCLILHWRFKHSGWL